MSQNESKDEILEQETNQEATSQVETAIEEQEVLDELDSSLDEIRESTPTSQNSGEITQLKDQLARTQADFENYKKRSERDREDMIFFLKADIYKDILPLGDDIERMLANTPESEQTGSLYEGLLALQKRFQKTLSGQGITSFESIGQPVDPEKHEVMTQAPGEEGIIIDEFEKGYMLGDRVVRVAKVVVGNGQ